jgi:Zn-dependent protease
MITDTNPVTEQIPKPKNSSKLLNIFFIGLKILTKITSIIAKFSKIALAGLSLAAYTYLYSWSFALMLMAQLFIHEYGHIWAMKRVGIKTKGIYFIPFVGGAAVASEDFKTRKDEVFVALMGPVFGFACAFIMLAIYYYTKVPMYAAGASWMAMINLFNLLPINPLDGGRVMKSIAFSMHSWVGYTFMSIGIVASLFLAFYAKMWLFILVMIISSLELLVEFWFDRKRKIEQAEYKEQCDRLRDNIETLRKHHRENNIPIPEDSVLRQDIKKLLPVMEIPPMKPSMSMLQILNATLEYFALAILLYLFMVLTMDIPGASLAMDVLR